MIPFPVTAERALIEKENLLNLFCDAYAEEARKKKEDEDRKKKNTGIWRLTEEQGKDQDFVKAFIDKLKSVSFVCGELKTDSDGYYVTAVFNPLSRR